MRKKMQNNVDTGVSSIWGDLGSGVGRLLGGKKASEANTETTILLAVIWGVDDRDS